MIFVILRKSERHWISFDKLTAVIEKLALRIESEIAEVCARRALGASGKVKAIVATKNSLSELLCIKSLLLSKKSKVIEKATAIICGLRISSLKRLLFKLFGISLLKPFVYCY